MLSGDIVLFNVATDRRNGMRRATSVKLHKLVEDQTENSKRETVSGSLAHIQAIMHYSSSYPGLSLAHTQAIMHSSSSYPGLSLAHTQAIIHSSGSYPGHNAFFWLIPRP